MSTTISRVLRSGLTILCLGLFSLAVHAQSCGAQVGGIGLFPVPDPLVQCSDTFSTIGSDSTVKGATGVTSSHFDALTDSAYSGPPWNGTPPPFIDAQWSSSELGIIGPDQFSVTAKGTVNVTGDSTGTESFNLRSNSIGQVTFIPSAPGGGDVQIQLSLDETFILNVASGTSAEQEATKSFAVDLFDNSGSGVPVADLTGVLDYDPDTFGLQTFAEYAANLTTTPCTGGASGCLEVQYSGSWTAMLPSDAAAYFQFQNLQGIISGGFPPGDTSSWGVENETTSIFSVSALTPGATLTVVPVPPALPLFASALGLIALRRKRA